MTPVERRTKLLFPQYLQHNLKNEEQQLNPQYNQYQGQMNHRGRNVLTPDQLKAQVWVLYAFRIKLINYYTWELFNYFFAFNEYLISSQNPFGR